MFRSYRSHNLATVVVHLKYLEIVVKLNLLNLSTYITVEIHLYFNGLLHIPMVQNDLLVLYVSLAVKSDISDGVQIRSELKWLMIGGSVPPFIWMLFPSHRQHQILHRLSIWIETSGKHGHNRFSIQVRTVLSVCFDQVFFRIYIDGTATPHWLLLAS